MTDPLNLEGLLEKQYILHSNRGSVQEVTSHILSSDDFAESYSASKKIPPSVLQTVLSLVHDVFSYGGTSGDYDLDQATLDSDVVFVIHDEKDQPIRNSLVVWHESFGAPKKYDLGIKVRGMHMHKGAPMLFNRSRIHTPAGMMYSDADLMGSVKKLVTHKDMVLRLDGGFHASPITIVGVGEMQQGCYADIVSCADVLYTFADKRVVEKNTKGHVQKSSLLFWDGDLNDAPKEVFSVHDVYINQIHQTQNNVYSFSNENVYNLHGKKVSDMPLLFPEKYGVTYYGKKFRPFEMPNIIASVEDSLFYAHHAPDLSSTNDGFSGRLKNISSGRVHPFGTLGLKGGQSHLYGINVTLKNIVGLLSVQNDNDTELQRLNPKTGHIDRFPLPNGFGTDVHVYTVRELIGGIK